MPGSGVQAALDKTIGFVTIFLKVFKVFLGFSLQIPDAKLRPTSTMKSTNKSTEQRFGHLNATNHNLYLNIILIELLTQ